VCVQSGRSLTHPRTAELEADDACLGALGSPTVSVRAPRANSKKSTKSTQISLKETGAPNGRMCAQSEGQARACLCKRNERLFPVHLQRLENLRRDQQQLLRRGDLPWPSLGRRRTPRWPRNFAQGSHTTTRNRNTQQTTCNKRQAACNVGRARHRKQPLRPRKSSTKPAGKQKQANKRTDRQTDKQTNRPTNSHRIALAFEVPRCMLHVARCRLHGAWCMVHAACCAAWCALCCMLHCACRMLYVCSTLLHANLVLRLCDVLAAAVRHID
jgi:hypothetical protein